MTGDPILRRLHACIVARVPCVYWGSPGTGKTKRVAAYAAARSGHYERWILSRCEPIDLKPRVYHEGRVVVAAPPEIDRCAAAAKEGKVVVLFADEMNRAPREVEGAFLDIADNPPPGVSIVMACNPPSRGQAARPLESATSNRLCHLEVKADARAWADAQIAGWGVSVEDFPLPAKGDAERADAKARALVSSWIRRREALLEKQPENAADASKAWPSPRTWEAARDLYAASLSLGLDAEDTRALVAGCVGDGPAIEFLTYAADADLPDPEELLANPKSYVPPRSRVDKTVAALTAVAGALGRQIDNDRWLAAWKLLGIVVDAEQADAGAVGLDLYLAAFRGLNKRSPELAKKLVQPPVMAARHVPRLAKLIAGTA